MEDQKMRLKVLEAIAEFTGLALDREILEKLAPQLQEKLARLHHVDELTLLDVEPAFILPQGNFNLP